MKGNKGSAERNNRPAEPIPANCRTHARDVCRRKGCEHCSFVDPAKDELRDKCPCVIHNLAMGDVEVVGERTRWTNQ
jgi:hypothetical protein